MRKNEEGELISGRDEKGLKANERNKEEREKSERYQSGDAIMAFDDKHSILLSEKKKTLFQISLTVRFNREYIFCLH